MTIDKELFQFEKDRYIQVDEDLLGRIDHIQFYNDDNSTTKTVSIINGKALIPDELLMQSLPIMAVGCKQTENGSYLGIIRKQFKVIPRARPGSYEEEESNVITLGMMPFTVLKKLRKEKTGTVKKYKLNVKILFLE